MHGVALSLCNGRFLGEGIVLQAKQRGLRVIWSSEMMWHHGPEIAAVAFGVIDKVLYVSEVQKQLLAPGYANVPSAITGNYIDPSFFPFSERQRAAEAPLVIGRLSRPDPAKFPPDFPEFYESLEDVTRIARMTRRGKQFAELRGIRVNHPAPGSASWPGARRWRRFMRGTASMRAGICWRRRRSRR